MSLGAGHKRANAQKIAAAKTQRQGRVWLFFVLYSATAFFHSRKPSPVIVMQTAKPLFDYPKY
ncbi:MAG: hypothetical protein V4812_20440, partial [Pseudomonadota bacterium]